MWSFFTKDPTRDFNYEIGELFPKLEDKSIWNIHKAKKKGTLEPYTIFALDMTTNGSETKMNLAKAAAKRLKMIRHPSILTYVDSLETDKVIYLVTEYVEPLEIYLSSSEMTKEQKQLTLSWGVHQITKALTFLNEDNLMLTHHNICLSSIFVNQAGEWKLGGVEYLREAKQSMSIPIKVNPYLEKYDPPEKNNPDLQKTSKSWSADMWGLGCVIWELYNGEFKSASVLKSPGKIPKNLMADYCTLVSANPASRPSPKEFWTKCRNVNNFMKNSFIDTILFLEEIQIKDTNEKGKFFSQLPQQLDSFPKEVCRHKILPQLIHAFEFCGAGPVILTPMFKLGKLLTDEEYQKKIVPCVIKLFSSTDRATRAKLLQQLEFFVDHLQPNVLNSQIFPEIVQGFKDTNATIREITVKSILHLAPKLNHNNLNVELMKHFAFIQARDTEGGIRTNTTVCLGKIAHHLHPDTRKKVLVTAFTRVMRDPFPHARTAGVLALASTQKFYNIQDIAQRIIPALSLMTVDPEKSVRDQAFKAIRGYLGKLEKVSEDPSIAEQIEAEVNSTSSVSSSVTDAALGWAGWAVTSLTSKLYKTTVGGTRAAGTKNPQVSNTTVVFSESSSTPAPVKSPVTSPQPTAEMASVNDEDVSDYEDESSGWGESWGDMDISAHASNVNPVASLTDGWDAGWDDDEFHSAITEPKTTTSLSDSKLSVSYQANKAEKHSVTTTVDVNAAKIEGWDADDGTWESNWGDAKLSSETTNFDKTKDERELKRQQRKKEMEEKRAMRKSNSGGPLKLGERKKL
ncbi:N-terminal kinase-like protein [Chamberlinius hualienensis]